jgi:RNA polymerase I-associated factor PAF67
MSGFQNGQAPARIIGDDSDLEEEALAADYREQVQYEGMDEMDGGSMNMAQQTDDIQSRLAAAAQPLDFSAPLEVKFSSYDNYCSLFHFILNSEGPVDLEPPSVGILRNLRLTEFANFVFSTTGLGMLSMNLSTNSTRSAHTEIVLRDKETMRRRSPFYEKHQTHGVATAF